MVAPSGRASPGWPGLAASDTSSGAGSRSSPVDPPASRRGRSGDSIAGSVAKVGNEGIGAAGIPPPNGAAAGNPPPQPAAGGATGRAGTAGADGATAGSDTGSPGSSPNGGNGSRSHPSGATGSPNWAGPAPSVSPESPPSPVRCGTGSCPSDA